ncbi:hypothetical protein Tco_1123436 [Tanacetum coccineum]|uniref:Phage protein n=1 Tax=Tanacetum coccineum TaxID=301880 RepID=A0ABQ5J3W5_9ASTR
MASKPKTIQEGIEIANDLTDQKIRTLAEQQAENKRKAWGKRNHIKDLNLYALNVTTIMIDSVLQSVATARGLAMSPGTVEPNLLLPTTKEPKGKIREFSLALNVELRAISRIMPEVKEQESGKSSGE